MKLATFAIQDRTSYGIVTGGQVADCGAALAAALPDLKAVIAAGAFDRVAAAAADAPKLPLDGVTLLPPIGNPDKIVCVGLNYADHQAEMGKFPADAYPVLFLRVPSSQVGHGSPLVCPKLSERFDYEGELAVIIGKPGRHIAEAEALSHVAGYSIYNDGSVRDFQQHTTQYTPGKNFKASGGFGPWMVTADEIPDPHALHLTTRLNGEVLQDADTSLMIHKIPKVIAYISQWAELLPGDVISSGTPGGVGASRKPPVWMRPGDVAEIEVTGIGTLSNPVVAED
ncbi:fumarylacetoacetate hydrolase family protein [Marinibaculum pumilum]|uniref:Fumarylacetoacetate hydrolase family protein n=1 Tax=Marinibaculum pumilum TaxID=1766165 RepID=A0ABV7L2R6_9PROT